MSVLTGEVREYTSEQPIPGIEVKILELDRVQITDRNGFFAFGSLAPGTWTFKASGLGYTVNVEASEVKERSFLLIRLAPSPIQLEGLYVSVVQGLLRRRMAVPSRVFAWNKRELEQMIVADVGSLIGRRGVARFVVCGGEFSVNDLPNCILRRGRVKRLRIFVDDVELMTAEGTSSLWAYDPTMLWALEFIPGCQRPEVRIYTRLFMDQVERGHYRLAPMICIP